MCVLAINNYNIIACVFFFTIHFVSLPGLDDPVQLADHKSEVSLLVCSSFVML